MECKLVDTRRGRQAAAPPPPAVAAPTKNDDNNTHARIIKVLKERNALQPQKTSNDLICEAGRRYVWYAAQDAPTTKSLKTSGSSRLVTKSEFMRLRDRGEMLEYAEVFDNYYATSRSQVEEHLADDRNVVLEIDWQGARQVRESMPECVTIFILPPSVEELERRLRDRRTDAPEVIERRLRDALSDMSHWDEFDHVIINDDLNQAISDLEDVLVGNGEASSTSNEALRRAVKRIIG